MILREGNGAAPHQPCLDRNEVIITALTAFLATEFMLSSLPALAEMKSQPQRAEKWAQEGFKLPPPDLVGSCFGTVRASLQALLPCCWLHCCVCSMRDVIIIKSLFPCALQRMFTVNSVEVDAGTALSCQDRRLSCFAY